MNTKQLNIWQSKFGQEWTDRNMVSPSLRVSAFQQIIPDDVASILEIGCGAGHNLIALSWLHDYTLVGIDPLDYAVAKARGYDLDVVLGDCFNIPFRDGAFDLVFTCGVLMHVAPEDLTRAAQEIGRVTRKYILVIEYYSEEEQVIPHRGHDNFLFKRDYSKLFPNCVGGGFLGKEKGFDNCNYWLFKKGVQF